MTTLFRRTHLALLGSLCLALAPIEPASAQHGPGMVLLPKQLAAPPEDILSGLVRLPDPSATPDVSRLAILPVTLERAPDGLLSWSAEIPIDDASRVRFALLRPPGEALDWTVTSPPAADGASRAPMAGVERASLELADGPRDAEVRSFVGAPRGIWSVRITPTGANPPDGAQLIVAIDSPHALQTHLTTLRLVAGRPIGIVAAMRPDPHAATSSTISVASLVLTGSDGTSRSLPMFDDGVHNDGAANDGVFGAAFTASAPGRIEARVVAEAVTSDGVSLLRTSTHRVRIVPAGVELLPQRGMFARALPDNAAPESTIRIDISAAFEDPNRRCFVGAEIWGHDRATNAPKPAAWAGLMTEPRPDPGADSVLSLHVDARWLARGSIRGPFELRNVRVQDPDTFAVLDTRDAIPLAIDARIALPQAAPREVDREMLVGRPRDDLALNPTIPTDVIDAARSTTRAFGAHNLMLVHGWCSGGNVWPAPDFTGYTEVFLDPDANRSHDQFAQLILALGNNSKSYGIIGHSQGGCAALHLLTFYFSGLDWATGPRLIQSVGSPYQGTPLASLGFFSCGVNDDLTPTGSAAWLANIPGAERASVYYYTTSPSSGNCDFFTNLVLASPNDGVTEIARDQLPGANSMGNTLGWCHTTGMNQPSQYNDHTRNAEMNTNAAR